MAESSQSSPGKSPVYRRSWKNLLINKRYQLRFTLFMVGLSAVLMMLLGIWVKRVADNTTEVGLARVRGEPCPPPAAAPGAPGAASAPGAGAASAGSAPATMSAAPGAVAGSAGQAVDQDPSVPSEVGEPAGSAAVDPAAAAGSAGSTGEEERPRGRVLIDESSMTITPTPPTAPADLAAAQKTFRECEQKQAGLIEDLQQRRRNIGWVLLGSGLLICLGLAVYGIKTTHRVAGPLHKVGTYFSKMREGKYGPVYPLRKGDELMEFYEHFKAAHAGVVTAERNDVAKMRAVVKASGSGPHDPQLAKALADLQKAIERKEKALE